LIARDEGMRGDAVDALALCPLGSREVQLLLVDVSDQHGLPRGADVSDDVGVQRKAAKETIERPILILRMEGSAGAGDQVKAPGAMAEFIAQEARIADVAGSVHPDPGQGDARL